MNNETILQNIIQCKSTLTLANNALNVALETVKNLEKDNKFFDENTSTVLINQITILLREVNKIHTLKDELIKDLIQ